MEALICGRSLVPWVAPVPVLLYSERRQGAAGIE